MRPKSSIKRVLSSELSVPRCLTWQMPRRWASAMTALSSMKAVLSNSAMTLRSWRPECTESLCRASDDRFLCSHTMYSR